MARLEDTGLGSHVFSAGFGNQGTVFRNGRQRLCVKGESEACRGSRCPQSQLPSRKPHALLSPAACFPCFLATKHLTNIPFFPGL